ncbi:c-type cytochrome [Aquabacterium sp. OR-4]|uniref:c-type cytochrome n=1 Tax=Aquabacterium sp. OR-4 TaxID=2978127 RepID=UPI0021B39E2F|nr:cytochrome c4 [Aquabacterium sp. OR-4]MDT7835814.1 cytochrome c4 [Aquabacterium sp. OR-4]
MIRLLTTGIALAAMGVAAQAQGTQGGDAAKGVGKAAMCIGCHGIIGYQATFPEVYKVPMISGQGAKYIVASLQAYQKGDRKHPTMRAIAASLTEQDMADLGAYYEQQAKGVGAPAPEALARPVPDALKDRMAACVACHGANFSKPIDPSYPKLAGQHADYLAATLRAYQTDGNANVGRGNATMRGQVVQEANGQKKHTFTSAELKAIGSYLASLPGDLHVVPQPRLR